MDQHLRNLIDHVALIDGGCTMTPNAEITFNVKILWAIHNCPVIPISPVTTCELFTLAFMAGDMIIGNQTTMN